MYIYIFIFHMLYHFDFFFLKKETFLLERERERDPLHLLGIANFVVVRSLSPVQFLVTSYTVTHQASLSMGFPRQNTGVGSVSFSRGSLWPRDQTHISCIGRQMLYHWTTGEANSLEILKKSGQSTSLICKLTSAEPDLILLAIHPWEKILPFSAW